MNDNVYCCVSHVSEVLRNSWETQWAPSYVQGRTLYTVTNELESGKCNPLKQLKMKLIFLVSKEIIK